MVSILEGGSGLHSHIFFLIEVTHSVGYLGQLF